ncbi:MAG: hypothetical protein R3B96_20620 [Pirellulaceae bacterium]
MVLGQSAATAAHLALEQQCDVQEIDIAVLQERLLADGQILQWQAAGGVDPARLPGIVLDDSKAITVENGRPAPRSLPSSLPTTGTTTMVAETTRLVARALRNQPRRRPLILATRSTDAIKSRSATSPIPIEPRMFP